MKKECAHSAPLAQCTRAGYSVSDRLKLKGDSSGVFLGGGVRSKID